MFITIQGPVSLKSGNEWPWIHRGNHHVKPSHQGYANGTGAGPKGGVSVLTTHLPPFCLQATVERGYPFCEDSGAPAAQSWGVWSWSGTFKLFAAACAAGWRYSFTIDGWVAWHHSWRGARLRTWFKIDLLRHSCWIPIKAGELLMVTSNLIQRVSVCCWKWCCLDYRKILWSGLMSRTEKTSLWVVSISIMIDWSVVIGNVAAFGMFLLTRDFQKTIV